MRMCDSFFLFLLALHLSACGMRDGEYYPPTKKKSCLFLTQSYTLDEDLMGRYLYPAGNYYPAFIDKNGSYYLSRKKVKIVLSSYSEDVNYGIYMTNGVPYVFHLDNYSGLPAVKIKNTEQIISQPSVTSALPNEMSALLQRKKPC